MLYCFEELTCFEKRCFSTVDFIFQVFTLLLAMLELSENLSIFFAESLCGLRKLRTCIEKALSLFKKE